MSRIKLGSRVSMEGWCFHSPTVTIHEDRLSWKVFGKKSLDSRVYGTVLGKNGGKWQVMWDIDNEVSQMECNFLEMKMAPHFHKYLASAYKILLLGNSGEFR